MACKKKFEIRFVIFLWKTDKRNSKISNLVCVNTRNFKKLNFVCLSSTEISQKILKFYWKKFRKFFIVNFRLLKNFLLLNSLKKKFKNVLQSISLKKKFGNFSENPKKNFCLKKNRRPQGGGISAFFPVKSNTTFHWVLTYGNPWRIFWKKMFLIFFQKSDLKKKTIFWVSKTSG